MDRNGLKPFLIQNLQVGDGPLTLIAGPCATESLELCLRVGEHVQKIADKLKIQYVFKASFDKANRSSVNSERGLGIDEGLEILRIVKNTLNIPITTDIHLPDQAKVVAEIVDMIQIPAFLCRQSDILQASASTGKPVNVKKGQFLAPHDTKNILHKLESFEAKGIMITERGCCFGYNSLIVDFPGLETMRSFGYPICFDATHSAQRPGAIGESTGGCRESIPAMTRAACAVGIDALFIETHPYPAEALSDKETQWPLKELEHLLSSAIRIREAQRLGGIDS